MPAATCPTCESLTLDGVCPQCAFSAALAGLNAGDASLIATDPGASEPPAPDGFELLNELGRGATAVVWLAREHRLDRLVALKFITAHVDRRLAQRLIREGQAAARLRHPNIVAVHAMNVTDTSAWLAMDFMPGGDLRQRLARGVPVPRDAALCVQTLANALSHAHAHSILHRDIKPSNVLLDDAGEPHLADFGLAAPLEGGGDITLPGQVAGTAAYLAPELLAGADHATPTSDIYSLGALLYECLTGRAPFVGDSAAAIFAQLAAGDPPAPRLLRSDIPRDLETICLKCLEKTPARRYASAGELEQDLGRFLRGESITARPVNFEEKTWRWCRRHPATATFASLAAALLLCLAIGGPLVALRLARARADAAAEAASSKAVSEFLQKDLLAQADPGNEVDREIKLRTVLDRAAKKIDGRFPQQPLVEADVRATLATTLYSLGDAAAARVHWERVRTLRAETLGAEHEKTLAAGAEVFHALADEGRFAEAEKLALEVNQIAQRALGPDHPTALAAAGDLALLYSDAGKPAQAEPLFVDLLARQRRLRGNDHADTFTVLNNLGLNYRRQSKLNEAERYYSEALAGRRRVLGDDHPSTLITMHNLSSAYSSHGKLEEARTLNAEAVERSQRVLGPEHPTTLVAMGRLALLHQQVGDFAAGETLHMQTLAVHEKKYGPQHPSTLSNAANLAASYRELGKIPAALQLANDDTLALRRRVLGPEHSATLVMTAHLAAIYRDAGRLEEARRLAVEGCALAERVLGRTHNTTLMLLRMHGSILLRAGQAAEAEPLLRRYLSTARAGRSPQFAIAQSDHAAALMQLGRHAEAEPLLLAAQSGLAQRAAIIPPADRREIDVAAERLAEVRRALSRRSESSTTGAEARRP